MLPDSSENGRRASYSTDVIHSSIPRSFLDMLSQFGLWQGFEDWKRHLVAQVADLQLISMKYVLSIFRDITNLPRKPSRSWRYQVRNALVLGARAL